MQSFKGYWHAFLWALFCIVAGLLVLAATLPQKSGCIWQTNWVFDHLSKNRKKETRSLGVYVSTMEYVQEDDGREATIAIHQREMSKSKRAC